MFPPFSQHDLKYNNKASEYEHISKVLVLFSRTTAPFSWPEKPLKKSIFSSNS